MQKDTFSGKRATGVRVVTDGVVLFSNANGVYLGDARRRMVRPDRSGAAVGAAGR